MKKDVIIEIRGVYRQEGDEDEIELFTTGSYYKRNGNYFIAYDESEATGFVESDSAARRQALVDFALPRNIEKLKADLERYRIHYDVWFRESELHHGAIDEAIRVLTARGPERMTSCAPCARPRKSS